MAWRCLGDKPLYETMMVSLPTHICVTRPQWIKTERHGYSPWYVSICKLSYSAFITYNSRSTVQHASIIFKFVSLSHQIFSMTFICSWSQHACNSLVTILIWISWACKSQLNWHNWNNAKYQRKKVLLMPALCSMDTILALHEANII